MFLTPTVLGGLFSRTDLASRLPTTNPGDGKPWIDADGQLRVGVSGTSLLDSWLGSKTTTSLAEGSNLYFTTGRVTGVVTKAYVDGLGVDALTVDGQTSANIVNTALSLGASSFASLAHTHDSIALQDGTAASPSARFASDTGTGLFRDAANKISFATGGVAAAELSQIGVGTWGQFHTGQLVLDPPDNVVGFWLNATAPSWEAMVVSVEGVVVLAADAAGVYTKSSGSAPATPGYSFDGDRDTGLYRAGANLLGLSGGGNKRFELTANGANLYQSDGTTGGTLVLSRLQSTTDDLIVLTGTNAVFMPLTSAFYPNSDFGPSLGQSTRRWKNVYAQSVLGGTSSALYVGTSSSATYIRTASSTGIIYFDIGNLLDNAIRFNTTSFSPYNNAPQTLGDSSNRWPNVFAKLANIEVANAVAAPALTINRLGLDQDYIQTRYLGTAVFRVKASGEVQVANSSGNPLFNIYTSLRAGDGTATYNGGVSLKATASNLAGPAYSFVGDTDTGLHWSAANTLSIVTGGVARLTVDSTGAVNAASVLTAPTAKLTTSATVGHYWQCTNVDGSGGWAAVTGGSLPSAAVNQLLRNTDGGTTYAGTDAIRVDGTGKVGIGQAPASHALAITGTTFATGVVASYGATAGFNFYDRGSATDYWTWYSTGNNVTLYSAITGNTGNKLTVAPSGKLSLTNGADIQVPLAGTDPGLLVNRLDTSSDIAKLQYDGVDRFRFYSDGTNDFFYLQGTQAQITRASTALIIRDSTRIDLNIAGANRAIITAGSWAQYVSIVPGSDLAIDLGQADKRWANIHGQNIRASGASAAIQINDRINNSSNWQLYSSSNLFFLYSNVVGNAGVRFQIDPSNFHYIRSAEANHQIVHKPSNAGHCASQWESATPSRSVGCGFIDSGNGSWRIGTITGGTDFYIQRGYVGNSNFALNTGGTADGIKVAADATITTVGLRAHPNNAENAYTLNVYGDGNTCVLRLHGGTANGKGIYFGASGTSDRILSTNGVTSFYAGGVIGFTQSSTLLTCNVSFQAGKLIRQAAEITQTPAGATQTLTLADGNHQTLALTGTSGTVAVTLTAPASSAAGTIIVKQHATTPVDLTWAGSPTWLGTEPDWGADAAGKVRVVAWRYDGTAMYLSATDSN
jgi:hypothetical protein